MNISISIRCPFDDNRTCLRQNCRGCDIRMEALMHIRDELDNIRESQINMSDFGYPDAAADLREE